MPALCDDQQAVTDVLRQFSMAAARRIALGFGLGVVFLFASFGGSEKAVPMSEGSNIPFHAAPLGLRDPVAARPACKPAGKSTVTYAVVVRGADVVARAQPGGGAVLGRFPHIDQNGYPSVFGVVDTKVGSHCGTTFYRVQLPVAPNGSTGWVAAWAVRLLVVHTRIAISLSAHRLVLYRNGRVAFRAKVAVGTPDTPTPTGDYFVNERFVLANPSGPFGVAALGISAHSTVLKNWVQGGPIGIHGTNEPTLIGDAASHGCVRLFNSDMSRLFTLAPAGTPVAITS
jgi:lipoprotein-anchoring transpeptidase ErfK/SrfK